MVSLSKSSESSAQSTDNKNNANSNNYNQFFKSLIGSNSEVSVNPTVANNEDTSAESLTLGNDEPKEPIINLSAVNENQPIMFSGNNVEVKIAEEKEINIDLMSESSQILQNPANGEMYVYLKDGSFISLQPGDKLSEAEDGTINLNVADNNNVTMVMADGRNVNIDGNSNNVNVFSTQYLKDNPPSFESSEIFLKEGGHNILQNPVTGETYVSFDDGTFVSMQSGDKLVENADGSINLKTIDNEKERKIYSSSDRSFEMGLLETKVELSSEKNMVINNPVTKEVYISLEDGTFISLPEGDELVENADKSINIKAFNPNSERAVFSPKGRDLNIFGTDNANANVVMGNQNNIPVNNNKTKISLLSDCTVMQNPMTGNFYITMNDGSFISVNEGDIVTEESDGTINIKAADLSKTIDIYSESNRSINIF